jgi:hypothetical protein
MSPFMSSMLADDDPSVMLGALRHAEKRTHAELLHRLGVQHLDIHAEVGQPLGPFREGLREEHVGRLIDEVARDDDTLGDRIASPEGLLDRLLIADRERDVGGLRRLLALLAPGPVALEGVGPQPHAECHFSGLGGLQRADWPLQHDRRAGRAGRELAHDVAAELDPVDAGRLVPVSQPNDEKPWNGQPGRGDDVDAGERLGAEIVGARGTGDEIAGRLQQSAGRGAEVEVGIRQDDEHAIGGCREPGQM